MRRDAALDAAAPHLHMPPPLPIFCTMNHSVNPYLLDTLASPRVPCSCLWTTPPSAMAVGTSHGQQMPTSSPDHHSMCQDPPDAHQDALNAIATLPCPFDARRVTPTMAPSVSSARTLSL